MTPEVSPAAESDANPPAAKWMGLIAGLSHNMIVGFLVGSFSVMLASVESRMHVTRAMSSAAGSLVIFGSALMSSCIGVLMARYSLRALMFAGALLSAAGYLVLAFTNSYPIYIACYLLLLGPSMAISGSVGPATLVTRWFTRNRGFALGVVHLSLGAAILPLLSNWVLTNYGAARTYEVMAAFIGFVLVPATLLIRNHPQPAQPSHVQPVQKPATTPATITVGQLLKSRDFYRLAMASAALIAGTMVLSFNMVPFTSSWGVPRSRGVMLLSIHSLSGMAGSVFFGWVADRIGGARGLALLIFDMAVLFALLLFNLPFPVLALVMGLLGMHTAGIIPNSSRALAAAFGPVNFSRAYGLSMTLGVPITVIALQATGTVYTRVGSYAPVITGLVMFYAVALPFVLFGGRRRQLTPIGIKQEAVGS
jgi:MFS family permease